METVPPPAPPWWVQWWWVSPDSWHAHPFTGRYDYLAGAVGLLFGLVIAYALWGRSWWRERDLLRKYRPGHTRR